MDETRVSLHKEYRQSFIKEGSIVSETEQEEEISTSTTSTLPIEEVIHEAKKPEAEITFSNNARRNHIIKIVVKISVAVLVLAGMVVLGIFAWGR